MAFNPTQARNPAGSTHGGEWTGKGSTGGSMPKNVSGHKAGAKKPIATPSFSPINLPHPDDPGGINNPRVIGKPDRFVYWSEDHARLEANTGKMTDDERYSLRSFTGPSFAEFRRQDRAGGKTKDVKDFYNAYEKLPVYHGEIYRGLAGLGPEAVNKLLSHDVLTLDAMSSFSRDPRIGIDFAETFTGPSQGVVLKMRSKTGRSVEHRSASHEEFEVMGGKGTSYKLNRAYYELLDGKSKPHLVIEGDEI